ncbi:MAG: hypothetical protein RRZ73_03745 [Oscillospiraceae bacterium]
MIPKINKFFCYIFTAVSVLLISIIPAFAINPAMGDESGPIKMFMTIALVVSVVLIAAVLFLTSKKNKNKTKK